MNWNLRLCPRGEVNANEVFAIDARRREETESSVIADVLEVNESS